MHLDFIVFQKRWYEELQWITQIHFIHLVNDRISPNASLSPVSFLIAFSKDLEKHQPSPSIWWHAMSNGTNSGATTLRCSVFNWSDIAELDCCVSSTVALDIELSGLELTEILIVCALLGGSFNWLASITDADSS